MKKPFRLLIIDDSQEILTALSKFFSKKKYEVTTAKDGLDGLKQLKNDTEGFDLVITDLVMPDISGYGIISIIKEAHPETPVVAITGWGPQPEALAIEAQADYVLEKPFDLKELDQLVTSLLESTVSTKQG